MKQRPLLVFAAMWVIGSSAASMYAGWWLVMVMIGLALLLTAVGGWLHAGRYFTACMLFSLLASAIYFEWYDARNVSELSTAIVQEGQADTVRAEAWGSIASPVEIDGDRADFKLALTEVELDPAGLLKTNETVLVQVRMLQPSEIETAKAWQRGDMLHMTGELQQPLAARNFDGFDYGRYLRTQKIHWILKVKGTDQVQATTAERWKPAHLLRWNDSIRGTLGDKLDVLYGGVSAGYMKGLVIGNQDDLDPDTFMDFSRLGLTHILAISGLHVAVVVGCLLFLCTALRMTRETSLTVVTCLIPVYVLLTGASPSIVRAGIMGMIGLYAAKRGLLKDGLHILSFAVLAMLLWNPYFLLNVSFQLSFIVTAGIMIFVPKLMSLLTFLPKWLAGTVGITVVAQLISFPLTIYYFNQVSLISVLANLIMVPVISSIVLPLGMLSLLLGWIWMGGARFVAGLTEWLNELIFRVVEWMNGPFVFMTLWPSPTLVWILMYYLLLYVLLTLLKKIALRQSARSAPSEDTVPLDGRTQPYIGHSIVEMETTPVLARMIAWLRWKGLHRAASKLEVNGVKWAIAFLAGAFCLHLYSGYHADSLSGAGIVQFIDVGQGDAVLITTPTGKHVLLDGGGTMNFRKESDSWKERKSPFEVGEKLLVPLLKKRGIHELEAVMISHGDQDHIGGLRAVVKEIPVRSVVFNGTMADSNSYRELMKMAIEKGIPLYQAGAGSDNWSVDNSTEIQFLFPVPLRDNNEGNMIPVVKNQNHASLVFILEMNGVRMLFTGDSDQAAEHKILLHLEEARRNQTSTKSEQGVIDVMKVAHHGSKTSTSALWLNYWQPRTAVISAGVNNMYGHPHPDIVSRLEQHGVFIYQTNLHGEVQLKVKNGVIETRTKLR